MRDGGAGRDQGTSSGGKFLKRQDRREGNPRAGSARGRFPRLRARGEADRIGTLPTREDAHAYVPAGEGRTRDQDSRRRSPRRGGHPYRSQDVAAACVRGGGGRLARSWEIRPRSLQRSGEVSCDFFGNPHPRVTSRANRKAHGSRRFTFPRKETRGKE